MFKGNLKKLSFFGSWYTCGFTQGVQEKLQFKDNWPRLEKQNKQVLNGHRKHIWWNHVQLEIGNMLDLNNAKFINFSKDMSNNSLSFSY